MKKEFTAASLALLAGTLAACGGSQSTGVVPNGPIALPPIESDVSVAALLPARSIGEELPSAGLGTIHLLTWKAIVGGFTQTTRSQTLAFPPGTKITIRNLSKTVTHTFDVVRSVDGPPADFPRSPKLSVAAHGNGTLQDGYASGPIAPGKAVTVTLAKAGTYLIGCAFHYAEGMRDVIVVSRTAKPGVQATPIPVTAPSPSSMPTSSPPGGGGWNSTDGTQVRTHA
jgi:plastocyanin